MAQPQNMKFLGMDFQIPSYNPNAEYDIRNAGQYGLSRFDPSKTEESLNRVAQNQIERDTGRQFRQAVSSGDTSPEISSYASTQSARDARNKSLVGLDQYAHEDQYKLLQSMLGIKGSRQTDDQLNFQKQQYEDQKPSWFDDFLSIAGVAAGAIPFFASGGEVLSPEKAKKILADGMVNGKPLTPAQRRYFGFIAGGGHPKSYAMGGEVTSDDILYANDGLIVPGMQNDTTNPIHSNPVNIQANEGERIMSQSANGLFAPALQAMENTAQKIMPTNPMAGANPMGGGASMANAGGSGIDIGGLAQSVLSKLGSMGGRSMYAEGGAVTDNPYSPEAWTQYNQDRTLFDEFRTMSPLAKQDLSDEDVIKYETAIDRLQKNPFNMMTPETAKWKQYYETGAKPNTEVVPFTPQGGEATPKTNEFNVSANQAGQTMPQQMQGLDLEGMINSLKAGLTK